MVDFIEEFTFSQIFRSSSWNPSNSTAPSLPFCPKTIRFACASSAGALFLQRELTFSHSESVCHTTEHVERVLLFALLLGRELEVSSDDLDALALCAVFHDTRRHDDDLDVGHGDRAAAYYREYASAHGRNVDDRVERIIARHDRHDRISEEKFRKEGADDETLLLYRIFKDADAIDRFRFGPKALNERYLRTSAARNLLPLLRPFVLRLTGYEA